VVNGNPSRSPGGLQQSRQPEIAQNNAEGICVWAYMHLNSGEQRYVSIGRGEPFFELFRNCKKGQSVTVVGLGNGRGIKNVTGIETNGTRLDPTLLFLRR
jgi:hypothetical protein